VEELVEVQLVVEEELVDLEKVKQPMILIPHLL
jgi:hypothetical protein